MSFDLELIAQLKSMNTSFREKFNQKNKLSKNELRTIIQNDIGKIISEYPNFQFKKIFAIDGSNNTYGDSYPYIIHLLRAGAFGSGNKKYDESQLLYATNEEIKEKIKEIKSKKDMKSDDMAYEFFRKQELAKLEMLVGIEIIKKEKPDIILFDGGLLRYQHLCNNEYKIYKELAEKHNVITAGVIEDIGTFIISKQLYGDNDEMKPFEYDKEILYGLLQYNESLIIHKDVEFKEDIRTAFSRFSKDPNPIGVDLFEHDEKYLEQILSLIKNTTSFNSRGIPILIDKVDEHVKIKDETVEQLLERYIDKDIMELYFVSKRKKR